MTFKRVGISSIGEMGSHWAYLLRHHGVEVLNYTKGRSAAAWKLAEQNFSLVQRADIMQGVNPVPRTCVRGLGALPFGDVQDIYPRTHVRGVLWYGGKLTKTVYKLFISHAGSKREG